MNSLYGYGGPQRLMGPSRPRAPMMSTPMMGTPQLPPTAQINPVHQQIAQLMGPAQFQAQPNRMMQIPRTPGAGTSY